MPQRSLHVFLSCIFLLLLGYYIFLIKNTSLQKSNSGLHIVCTTTIIADAIKQIAKDNIQLTILMGPGVDPHTYKPIEQDIIKIAEADIIFYHGLHLEARMSDLFEHMKTYKTTIAASHAIPTDKLIFDAQFKNHPDPHVWFDPELWSYAIENIAYHLQQAAPDYKNTYEINKKSYLKNIFQMHEKNKILIQQIPIEQRILITGHDAFSYFARAYQFKVFSLQGINTASQAGTKDVQKIIKIILDHKIKSIFPENSIPARNMQSLMESVQIQGQAVNIGHELFSDSLGSIETQQGTYIGMMQGNVATIVNGLL